MHTRTINIMREPYYTLFAHVADGRGEQWHIIITIESQQFNFKYVVYFFSSPRPLIVDVNCICASVVHFAMHYLCS